MRVTNDTSYTNYMVRQGNVNNKLTDLYDQISSGKSVRFGYQNVNSFTNALRLDYDEVTIKQTIQTTTGARSFSDNTDASMSEMTKTLDTFKQKLIAASSDTNNTTNYTALAAEMRGLVSHLRDVANTSINGQFLFSGSAMSVKPFDSQGNYQGNNDQLKALVGSEVGITYNVDGQSLMLGQDSDYRRSVTTNIPLVNRTKQNADIAERLTSDSRFLVNLHNDFLPRTEAIVAEDYIGDITGDYTNATYFYVSGTKHDGSSIKAKIELNPTNTVEDLLSRIKAAFGNTVRTSINSDGYIELEDIQSGSSHLEFHMVASTTNVDDLNGDNNDPLNPDPDTTDDVYSDIAQLSKSATLFEFQRSGSAPRSQSTLNGVTRPYDHTIMDFNTQFTKLHDGAYAKTGERLDEIFGGGAFTALGIKINGAASYIDLGVTGSSSLGDMVNAIQTQLDNDVTVAPHTFIVGVESGKLTIKDTTPGLERDGQSTLTSFELSAVYDSDGDTVLDAIETTKTPFEASNAIEKDRIYFDVDGATLRSNAPQMISKNLSEDFNTIATPRNRLIDTANVTSLEGRTFTIQGRAITGEVINASIGLGTSTIALPSNIDLSRDHLLTASLTSPATSITIPIGKTLTVLDPSGVATIYDSNKPIPANTIFPANSTFKSGSTIPTGMTFPVSTFTTTNATTGLSHTYNIFNAPTLPNKAVPTPPNEVTFQQLNDVMNMIMTGTYPASDTTAVNYDTMVSDYTKAVTDSASKGSTHLDAMGRFSFTDLTTKDTQAQLMMYDSTINDFRGSPITARTAMTFHENDALTIDDPQLSIFDQLEKIISEVELGKTRPDGNASGDLRGIGMSNSLKVIDHIYDHISKKQTENGANANSLTYTQDRAEIIKVNTLTLRSQYTDIDQGEAYVEFNQLALNLQAMMSTISKINQLSLVNYI